MVKQLQLNLKKNKLKFSVTVTLKKDVLDPQGKVVQNTLQNLGMTSLKSLRQGKYFEIEVEDTNQEIAKKKIDEISKKPFILDSSYSTEVSIFNLIFFDDNLIFLFSLLTFFEISNLNGILNTSKFDFTF